MTTAKLKPGHLRLPPWMAMLVVILLAVVLYARVLSFGYVSDDILLFLNKSALMNEPLSWGLLTEPVLPGSSYMRPLVFLTLYTEFHLFGQDPAISHAVNLLLFIINALLVFTLCRRIAQLTGREQSTNLALLAAVIYVLHPALVESTAWISGRFDIMVTLFMLMGCVTYLAPAIKPWQRTSLICILMLLALLSKELGIVLPGILLCLWTACNASPDQEKPRQTLLRALRSNSELLLALAATVAVYAALRAQAMHQIYHSTLTIGYLKGALVDNLLPLEALKFYVAQTLIPFHNINPLHPTSELQPFAPTALLGSMLAAAGMIFMLAWALLKRSSASWVFVAGLLCLLPVMHFVPLGIGGNIGHNRFMTAPLAFWSTSLALIRYDQLLPHLRLSARGLKRILLVGGTGWAVLAMLTTYSVMPFWKSELRLWNWAYHAHPTFDYARNNYLYGAMYEKRYDLVEAEILKEQKLHHGLNVADQILYADLLIRTGNPEGLNYLEGIIYALPKFHENPENRAAADQFVLSAMQMGGVYSDYAIGMMQFKGDAQTALKYNRIAEWYLQSAERQPIYYQRIAILYALGSPHEAEKLLQQQESSYYFNKAALQADTVRLLQKYCSVREANEKACQNIANDSLFKKLESDASAG